ncbi:MAG TPA: DUF362 domain-containing protein [Candidatus Methanoperedens sp.]
MVLRREFLKRLSALLYFIFSGCLSKEEILKPEQTAVRGESAIVKSKVYVIKTGDRKSGITELLKNFNFDSLSGKKVAIKANYNSADPFPASTHIATLSAIVDVLKEHDARIVLAERSGMGDTNKVLEDTGVIELAGKKGFDVVILDELKNDDWAKEKGSHWGRGFLFPKVFREADAIVTTCCLKTHRFGGHITMSLKNSVGMAAKYDPDDGYNYMSELHSSRYQRLMIAEINAAYAPEFIIMDGIKGFSKGGPDTGTLIEPGVLIASSDRVALDAAGVCILRIFGTTGEVSRGDVFKQEQIARAAELGLGASGSSELEIIPVNQDARDICSQIEEKLKEQF